MQREVNGTEHCRLADMLTSLAVLLFWCRHLCPALLLLHLCVICHSLTALPSEFVSRLFSISLFWHFFPFNSILSLSLPLHVQYWDWRKCGPSMRNCFYLWSMAFHSAASRIGPQNECQFNTLLYTLSPVIFGSLYVSDFDRLHFSSLWVLQHLCLCEKILIYAAISLVWLSPFKHRKSFLSWKSKLTLQKLWLWNKTKWENSFSVFFLWSDKSEKTGKQRLQTFFTVFYYWKICGTAVSFFCNQSSWRRKALLISQRTLLLSHSVTFWCFSNTFLLESCHSQQANLSKIGLK